MAIAVGVGSEAKRSLGTLGYIEGTLGGSVDRYRLTSEAHAEDRTTKWRAKIPIGLATKINLYESFELRPAVLSHFYYYWLDGSSKYDAGAFAPDRYRSL